MKKNKGNHIALFGSVKILVFAALLCAISGVMKFIAPSGDTWRISLENFPIIFGGIVLGPAIGGAVGICADLLGCLFRGYAINPFITAASMSVGIVSGAIYKYFKINKNVRLVIAAFAGHVIGNVVIKTFALHKMVGTPLGVLFAERIFTYTITAAIECVILIIIINNKSIKNGLKRVTGNDDL